MADQVIKLKCGKCGHRTLHTFRISGDSMTADSRSKSPAHIHSQPAGREPADVSRWQYRCKCGADYPVKMDTLSRALSRARDRGRRVVWLPRDLRE